MVGGVEPKLRRPRRARSSHGAAEGVIGIRDSKVERVSAGRKVHVAPRAEVESASFGGPQVGSVSASASASASIDQMDHLNTEPEPDADESEG